jgi:hypothetical protein
MKASMKCSNCGAEMSNLNMTWGKKQMWFLIPVMFLGFLPIIKMTFFKGDVTKDLAISDIQTRTAGKSLEIVGLITNSSGREWSGITVQAEFFDASGKFVDEASEYLRSEISGKSKEHFKIVISSPPDAALNGEMKPVVKISGGHTSPF